MPAAPRPAPRRLVVRRAALALAAGGLVLGGCTSRPTTRIAAEGNPARDGWARFGRPVRLNLESGPLPSPAATEPPAAPAYDLGPRGATGAYGTGPDVATTAGPYGAYGAYGAYGGYGAYGYGYGVPGGAVPPGLRVPADAPPASPFAAPYRAAFPGGDVASHRPGLSTGSGVHGRTDPPPAR